MKLAVHIKFTSGEAIEAQATSNEFGLSAEYLSLFPGSILQLGTIKEITIKPLHEQPRPTVKTTR